MSGPFTEDPRLSPVELVPLHYQLLAVHTNDSVLGYCALCEQSRCDYWRLAYEELFRAGELVGAHKRWRDLAEPVVGTVNDLPELEQP